MLMSVANLRRLQSEGRTMVDYLIATVLNNEPVEWPNYVVSGVSDVDEARTVYLMPSDMQLTLFEREVSKEALHGRLRSSIGELLAKARSVFDLVLVDCPPGLSVLTECWLREADFHLSPTKPDYISVCGLDVFRRFKELNPEMGFADNLGVLVNMIDQRTPEDLEYHRWLAENPDNRCFTQVVPRLNALQQAARYSHEERSYAAKYPGEIGVAMRGLAGELLARLSEHGARSGARLAAGDAQQQASGVESDAAAQAAAAVVERGEAAPGPAAPQQRAGA
jgi:chromosome partitioning protein